jgi:hypothetical protein
MNRREFCKCVGLGAAVMALPHGLRAVEAPAAAGRRPNILIILADDLGFSDIGCYGGGIRAPNLDGLAARGLRLTEVYNSARCCPSRASLLTGLYPHQAGVGMMTADEQRPGYRGHLVENCITIAEVLKAGDRVEMKNVAAEHPDLVKEMAAKWDEWAARCSVLRTARTGSDQGPRAPEAEVTVGGPQEGQAAGPPLSEATTTRRDGMSLSDNYRASRSHCT